ncbi:MAG: DUF2085 domain-containing protein [Halobacteriales archaeon]|nr:DUF2085 domain-containing protein [Halobacteriales archaeon]
MPRRLPPTDPIPSAPGAVRLRSAWTSKATAGGRGPRDSAAAARSARSWGAQAPRNSTASATTVATASVFDQALATGWRCAPPAWFGRVWHCHGIPDRCFRWDGRPMWLCARCVGVLAGQGVAAVGVAAAAAFSWRLLATPWGWGPACLAIAACTADWALQTWLGLPSTNGRRLVTGFFGGAGVIVVFGSVLAWALRS